MVEVVEVVEMVEVVDVDGPDVAIVLVEVMVAVGGTVPSEGEASQVCTRKP